MFDVLVNFLYILILVGVLILEFIVCKYFKRFCSEPIEVVFVEDKTEKE